jgi:phage-related protein
VRIGGEEMNLLDLFVKISVDNSGADKGFAETSDKANSLADKLKNGLATAAKVSAAAIGAAATGVAALVKQSVDSYGDYEQLVGGVETLFKQSQDVVMGYAENAYKTAGLSANEYMETVTSFSASLLQSLGGDTDKAAEKANLAITDMADNANKMGTSMESIQNAYRGFAKANYTMLDNLQLGYGGTKEEMERLLADAEKLSGIKYDISSYSDIVDAIHVVQTEMGITGTTAKEASTTIQGSVSAMKSAWANLVTGIANENADLGELIGNVVESATTAAGNIIPRIEQILSGIGEAITGFAPVLSELIPEMISSTLPALLTAAISLTESALNGIVSVLPALLTTALDALPQLLSAASSIVQNLVSALAEAAPQVLSAGAQLLDQLTSGIESGLPDMISRLPQIIDGFLDYITDSLPTVLEKGEEILGNLIDGIINAIPALIDALPKVIISLTTFFAENGPKIAETGINLLGKLIVGIVQAIPTLVKALPQIISAIVQGIGNLMSEIVGIGKNIVKGIWTGIQGMAKWIKEKVTGFFSGIVSGVKSFLGIKSPSRVFAGIGKYMAEGLGDGWDSEYGKVRKSIESGLDFDAGTVDYSASAMGLSQGGVSSALRNVAASIGQDYTIVVQSVLDGKVIGETAYKYNRQMQRAVGV